MNVSKVLIYQNDNQGSGSANTGFFIHFRQGTLSASNFTILNPVPNEIVGVNTNNINDKDLISKILKNKTQLVSLPKNFYINLPDELVDQIMAEPIISEPNSICTETYLILDTFESEFEAIRFAKYVRTRFFRFLVALRKNTQNMSKSVFAFVPLLQDGIEPDDKHLYLFYGINSEEIKFIESIVREMPETDR